MWSVKHAEIFVRVGLADMGEERVVLENRTHLTQDRPRNSTKGIIRRISLSVLQTYKQPVQFHTTAHLRKHEPTLFPLCPSNPIE